MTIERMTSPCETTSTAASGRPRGAPELAELPPGCVSLQIGKRLARPLADLELDELASELDLESMALVDSLGRLTGSGERARDDRVDPDAAKRFDAADILASRVDVSWPPEPSCSG